MITVRDVALRTAIKIPSMAARQWRTAQQEDPQALASMIRTSG